MRIESIDGEIVLKEVFNGVGLESEFGEEFGIAMRDSGFEFNYGGTWYEAKKGKVSPLTDAIVDMDDYLKNDFKNNKGRTPREIFDELPLNITRKIFQITAGDEIFALRPTIGGDMQVSYKPTPDKGSKVKSRYSYQNRIDDGVYTETFKLN